MTSLFTWSILTLEKSCFQPDMETTVYFAIVLHSVRERTFIIDEWQEYDLPNQLRTRKKTGWAKRQISPPAFKIVYEDLTGTKLNKHTVLLLNRSPL